MSEQVTKTHWMFEIWVRVIRALDRSSMDVRTAVRSQRPTFKFMSNDKLSCPDSNNFVFFLNILMMECEHLLIYFLSVLHCK